MVNYIRIYNWVLMKSRIQVTGRYTRIWVFRYLPTTSDPWPRVWLKVSWCGKPPCTATRQILKLTEGWPRRLTRKPRAAGDSRPFEAIARDGQVAKRIAFGADQPSALRLFWLSFSVIFLSCKANVRVFYAKSGHGPHSPAPGAAASPKRLTNVA